MSRPEGQLREIGVGEPIAFIFPGQGSQAVGMGADVVDASPAARTVFERADRRLGFALSARCFQGPEETLKETSTAQPAIVAVSLALFAALEEYLGRNGRARFQPAYVAGHSVGEYAALVASGALDLEAALALVRERGRLMHEEGTVCPGGMAAVLGLEDAILQEVCAQATEETLAALGTKASSHPGMGRVVVANYNSPGQVVISGEQQALARAMELASARGAKRVVALAVSGAFHSPVMEPAAAGLARAVDDAPLGDATIPLVSNISATSILEAAAFRTELTRQIVSPVQWIKSVEFLSAQGVTIFVEIGPGQVLSGLVKRIVKGVTTLNISAAADVERVGNDLLSRLKDA
jgi:[acyl-carrier-protein] S-malonyltransferase